MLIPFIICCTLNGNLISIPKVSLLLILAGCKHTHTEKNDESWQLTGIENVLARFVIGLAGASLKN